MSNDKKKKTMEQIAADLAADAKANAAQQRKALEDERLKLEPKKQAERDRLAAVEPVYAEAKLIADKARLAVRALKLFEVAPLVHDLRGQHDGSLRGQFTIETHTETGSLEWVVCLRVTIGSKEAWTLGFAKGSKTYKDTQHSVAEPIIVACLHRYSTDQRQWFDQINPYREKDKAAGWASDIFGDMFAAIDLSH